MKTALLKSLLLQLQRINAANKAQTDDIDGYWAEKNWNRRQFLAYSTMTGVAATLPSCSFKTEKTQPTIAIIGAGLAGLNAAWVLKQAGLKSTIYEAGFRIGGRIFTQENLLGKGLMTEMGAEFIDTNHAEIWRLIKQFNLETIDLKGAKSLVPETYFFNGKHFSQKEIVAALRPFAPGLQTDLDAVRSDKTAFKKFDYISLAAYFEKMGLNGWLKELLDTAFLSEYGWECDKQSSLNMLTVMSSDYSHNQFSMYGESDERFKVKGGNELIIRSLEKEMKENIKVGHQLMGIEKKSDNSYLLTFLKNKDALIKADIVILALPFTKLREVELRKTGFTKQKIHAINNYQLGSNGKVVMGFNTPFWQNQKNGKFLGNAFTDQFICGWDNSLLQGGTTAGYTLFYGGQPSKMIGSLDNNGLRNKFLPEMEMVFQGAKENFNEKVFRYHWQENSLSLGSYTCFAPGHYTEILPHAATTIGNIYFAGEHCSDAFQGFMNGAAQTGRDAAEAILKSLAAK